MYIKLTWDSIMSLSNVILTKKKTINSGLSQELHFLS